MKKLFILIPFIFIGLIFSSCGKKDDKTAGDTKTDEKKTEIKDIQVSENTAFHITYEANSKDKDKDKGMSYEFYMKGKQVKTVMHMNQKDIKTAEGYFKDGIMYVVMEMNGNKMGMKMDTKTMKGKSEYGSELITAKDRLKDLEKAGTGDVIGYKCDIYKSKDGVTYYFYKDMVPLKVESVHGVTVATKFEPDAKFDDKLFDLPKDVTFSDMGNLDIEKMSKGFGK